MTKKTKRAPPSPKQAPVGLVMLSLEEMQQLSQLASRLMGALGHLRDAWKVADAWGRKSIVLALVDLMASQELQQARETALKVLRYGLTEDECSELLTAMFPREWRRTRTGPKL